MGGIGKTTLAAMVVRDTAVRRHFQRVVFITVGNQPELLVLQRQMYQQLVGSPMQAVGEQTVAGQLAMLKEAAAAEVEEKRLLLLVLDDIWATEQVPQLNFLPGAGGLGGTTPTALPGSYQGSRLLVTSRFSKMVEEDCAEFVIGLLPEPEAVDLLMRTAQLEPTAKQLELAAQIAKQCGALPLFITLVGANYL